MTVTAETIRDLVDQDVPVYWTHEGYQVLKDSIGQYDIVCLHNDHRIGLTWRDNVTLNGKPEDFYALIPPGHPLLDHNRNGTYYCTVCHCVVILFDDDVHTCTLEDWKERTS